MTEFHEVEGDQDDVDACVLDTIANGMPYAFITATSLKPLDLRVASNHETGVIRALLNQTLRALPGGASEITDGFHTFDELYDHRRALTAALAKAVGLDAWRSKAHHPEDNPMFEGGYFIVGLDFLGVGTVTYHYKLTHWDDFAGVIELEHAPKWDGAGPSVSVDRLLEWAMS